MVTTKSGKTHRDAARRRRGRAAAFSLACAVAASVVIASSAWASTASVSGGALTYTAVAGETNNVTISLSGADHRINDTGATITPGAGCTTVDASTVDCSGVTAIVVNAGDMGDTVTISVSTTSTLNGGAGDDRLTGGSGDDILDGDAGIDIVMGGSGDDTLDGGTEADLLQGDAGTDTATYASRSAAVTADIGGSSSDGEAGEGDIVSSDIENLTGGSGDDTLTGDGAMNTITGNGGDDALSGGGGDDILSGGSGDDTLDGGTGADTFSGGGGSDAIWGDYSSRTNALVVSIDGASNDGEVGENDNVQTDMEVIFGGSGDDNMTGGPGAETLIGCGGNDVLSGGAGDDSLRDRVFLLCNGGGSNTFDGGSGADTFEGGAGTDTVTYASRSAPVTVTIDGVANDGEAGEGDNVKTSIDSVTGGSGDDTLTGSSAANTLSGGAGSDTLDGGAGADVLSGGAGADLVTYASRSGAVVASLDGAANDGESGETDNIAADVESITGGSGNDTLVGDSGANTLTAGAGNDVLDGGAGADALDGGAGADTFTAGPGTDTIQSRDGTTDSVFCGADLDSVVADTLDTIQADCEQVDRQATGGGGGDPGGGDSGAGDGPPVKIMRRSVRMTRRGLLRIRVRCLSADQRCRGRIKLRTKRRVRVASGRKARRLTLGRRRFSIPARRTRTVRVRLKSRNRRVVRRLRRVRVRAVASISGRSSVRKTLKVKAPKRKRSRRTR